MTCLGVSMARGFPDREGKLGEERCVGILVQCHFCRRQSLPPRILLCSHSDAFGTFALGPEPRSNVAAHVPEQLLCFTQSRSRLPGGGNISYLAALYSQHVTSVKPVGIREDKDAG